MKTINVWSAGLLISLAIILMPAGAHAGLVGYWGFEEGSGLVVKVISGNGNTGWLDAWVWNDESDAYVPNADFAPTWTTGKYGYGLDFDPSYDEERGGVTPYSRPMVFVETHGSESDDGSLNLIGPMSLIDFALLVLTVAAAPDTI